jgi:hypothetical protein
VNIQSVAIIGAGNVAGGYDLKKQVGDAGIYTHAGAYTAHGGFSLKTVFDRDLVRVQDFSRAWKAAHVAVDVAEIFGGYHDVVSVCSPDHTHFGIVRDILTADCCRTVFVEKPLAASLTEIEEIVRLSEMRGIHIVINFQRRNEPVHQEVRGFIASHPGDLLSVTGHYMKGLQHIGVTMIDSLCYLCGYPDAVLAHNRVFNREIANHSYEFILYYPDFTAAVKTTDSDRFLYNYHIFEIDLLFSDRRVGIVSNSQGIREAFVADYTYSGVKAMNDREARYRETGYKHSMCDAVSYIHDITAGKVPHEINTPQSSYNNLLITNRVIESFDHGLIKLNFEQGQWKR